MSAYNKDKHPALVTNPLDGVTYDLTQFFIHLEKHELTPLDISEQLKKAIDNIPLVINQNNIDYLRDIQVILINLQDLRDAFNSIETK